MNSDRRNRAIVILVLLAAIVGGWYLLSYGNPLASNPTGVRFVGAAATVASDYIVPPMERDYTNKDFRFSLKLPQGFTAAELPSDGEGIPVVLQDSAGNGIQIYVRDIENAPKNLTEADIRASISDMKVESAQVVEIGANNKGVAFLSDSPDFGGYSREVWFFFGGKLYQISTYARLDNLLQAMFGTWQFY